MNNKCDFFALGLSCTMVAFPATSLFYCSNYIDGFVENNALKNKPSYTSFSKGIKKEVFNKWFESYLTDSDNLTQKKYKTILTKIWLNSVKDTYIIDNFQFRQKLHSLNLELKNETRLEISNLLENDHRRANSFSFIVEDLHQKEKIEIAKLIAKDFKDAGLIGRNFKYFYSSDFKTLAFLYDDKLDETDILYLKKQTEKFQYLEPIIEIVKNANIKIIALDTSMLEKFIYNENVIYNLQVLNNYFDITYINTDIKQKLTYLIKKKKDYLHLEKALSSKSIKHNEIKKI